MDNSVLRVRLAALYTVVTEVFNQTLLHCYKYLTWIVPGGYFQLL